MSSLTTQNKRRKYSTRACVFCRNRHKKCDGGQPCVACDQRKQECVYPEQQKKRGPKPRTALNLGGTSMMNQGNTGMGSSGLTTVEFSSKPNGAIAVVNTTAAQTAAAGQGKTKRRRLSLNSEERLPAASVGSTSSSTLSLSLIMADGNSVERINLCHWLQEIIQLIQLHPHVYPFLRPVSISDAPDYYDVIEQPMDFSTMNEKINTFQYVSLSQFYNDLNLLVDNCRKYNQGTRSAYLIDWAMELQQTILQEIQKRTDTALIWYPQPIDCQLDHFDSYRTNNELEIDLYPQMLSTPLENWSIFDSCDFLDSSLSSPYSEQEFQV